MGSPNGYSDADDRISLPRRGIGGAEGRFTGGSRIGFLGWFLIAVGTVGLVLTHASVTACQSGVGLARTIGTADPQQTCGYWHWGWEGSLCLVGVGILLIVWNLGRGMVLGITHSRHRRP